MQKSTLNKAQKEAIEYSDGPLLIVAGAGTGKTTVITQKIAHLITSEQAKPEEILALTFTDKAAGEMEERVDQLLDIGYVDMQISTFHAFCQRILEQYGLDVGIPNQFKLLSEIDAWLLVREHFDKFDLDYYRPLGNPNKHIHELIRHFQKCKDELISPEEYLAYAENVTLDSDEPAQGGPALGGDERSRLTEVANAHHVYNQILLDNGGLDFADLIYYTHKLLTLRPNILAQLQARFKHILVDEFQDVNAAQYALVKLIAQKSIIVSEASQSRGLKDSDVATAPRNDSGGACHLTVVGDDDQSIYAFRGASVSNILRFKDDFKKAKEVVLNENYRSAQEILDLSYKSIEHNNPDRLEVKLGIDKKLVSKSVIASEAKQSRGGRDCHVAEAPRNDAVVSHLHNATLDNEVQNVVQEIARIKKEEKDCTWDDIAILVRANNHAEPFIQALESADIPYEFLSSTGLYRQPIVLDCINFLKLLDNYHESTAVYQLLRMPFLSFSESDMQKFTGMAKKKSTPYYEALKRAAMYGISHDGVEVCNKLVSLIHSGMKQTRFDKPTTILYHFLEESGYLAYLAHEEGQGNRTVLRALHHLKQFFDMIQSYEQAVPGATVASFMHHYRYVQQAGDDGRVAQPADTPDSVNILTVHGSKGLEFRYVFIVNLVEDRFPSRSRKDAIEIPEPLIKEQLPEGNSHEQEERRLLYVAMTRAKERLYLTSADNYGGVRKKKISRFLSEIGLTSPAPTTSESTSPKRRDVIRSVPTTAEPRLPAGEAGTSNPELSYPTPKAFSYSQLRSYQTCPYQYKLAHILKIPMKGSASFSFGSTIHKTLQTFYESIKERNSASQVSLFAAPSVPKTDGKIDVPTQDELLEMYEKHWIEDWYASKKQREDYQKKGKDILKMFYAAQEEAGWTVPVSLEGWFKIKVGEHLIHGRIDRIDQKDDGTLHIIDYKTGQSKEKLTTDDKDQLLIYQLAAQTLPEYRNIGGVSALTFYYVNDGVTCGFIGKDKDLERIREKVVATADNIVAGNFDATPNKRLCARCDFRDICEFRA